MLSEALGLGVLRGIRKTSLNVQKPRLLKPPTIETLGSRQNKPSHSGRFGASTHG